MLDAGNGGGLATLILGIVALAMAIIVLSTSIKVVNPGHTLTVQFFGRYIGTLRRTGLSFVPPLSITKKVSVRVRNVETNESKVNDYNGNPITIASIIVCQVADTAQAMLQRQQASAIVEAREKIVEGAVTMVESALSQLEEREIVDLDPERRAADS